MILVGVFGEVPFNGFLASIYNGSLFATTILSLCLLAAPLGPLFALAFTIYLLPGEKI